MPTRRLAEGEIREIMEYGDSLANIATGKAPQVVTVTDFNRLERTQTRLSAALTDEVMGSQTWTETESVLTRGICSRW